MAVFIIGKLIYFLWSVRCRRHPAKILVNECVPACLENVGLENMPPSWRRPPSIQINHAIPLVLIRKVDLAAVEQSGSERIVTLRTRLDLRAGCTCGVVSEKYKAFEKKLIGEANWSRWERDERTENDSCTSYEHNQPRLKTSLTCPMISTATFCNENQIKRKTGRNRKSEALSNLHRIPATNQLFTCTNSGSLLRHSLILSWRFSIFL